LLRLSRFHPVVRRARILLAPCADEGHLLGPRHVAWIAPVQNAVRVGLFVQPKSSPRGDQLFRHLLRFAFRSVAPDDLLWPRHSRG